MSLRDIQLIEIELYSFCNRKCKWCTNTTYKRNFYEELPEKAFRLLMMDLQDIDYDRYISYSRYNEPMFNIDLLSKRLSYVKTKLPNAKQIFNTNGDYLNRRNLSKITANEISIMDYNCKGMETCKETMIGCGIRVDKEDYPYIYGHHENIEKVLYYVDWPKSKTIRNRLNGDTKRSYPCNEPNRFIGIDYNGSVVPCCDVRHECPKCRNMIFGNIISESLDSIFNKKEYKNFRKNCSIGIFDNDVCKFCDKGPGRYTGKSPGIKYI
jgi:hypothetical protein